MDVEEMEAEAEAIKTGADPAEIKDPDEVIAEMDEEIPDADTEDGELETETN
jgi:hypothetical protein